MSEKKIDFDALSDRYADPNATFTPVGPALTGEAVAAAGREFAIAEYGLRMSIRSETGVSL